MAIHDNIDDPFAKVFKEYAKLLEEQEQMVSRLVQHFTLVLVSALVLFVSFNAKVNGGSLLLDILYVTILSSSVLCILLSLVLLYGQLFSLKSLIENFQLLLNRFLSEGKWETTILEISKIPYFNYYLSGFIISYVIFFVGLVSYGIVSRFLVPSGI